MHFTITGAENIVCYIEDFTTCTCIKRFVILRLSALQSKVKFQAKPKKKTNQRK